MPTVNTVHLLPFVMTFLLSLMIIITYNVIRPEYTIPLYNFSPFPTLVPKDIPNANIDWVTKCRKSLTPPDHGSCAMCGDDFVPTEVGHQEVIFNGQKVPPGTWCLPDGLAAKGCGTYTGRAVWSDSEEGQGWSCTCLYPDLYGGDLCMTKLACRDPTSAEDQSKNVLKSKDGHIWDPTKPDFNPMGRTPYDKDEQGNALYECSCDQNLGNTNKTKYVKLPNDPYRCHVDPCTTLKNMPSCSAVKSGEPCGFNEETQQCDCARIRTKTFAHSNTDGKCYNAIGENCPAWDDEKQICACGNDEMVDITCESQYMNRPSYDIDPDTGKTYKCPNNVGGSYCISPCQSCMATPCPCDPTGSISCTVDKENKTFKCNCKDTDTNKHFGERCEKTCIKDGVQFDGGDQSVCCSGKSHVVSAGSVRRYYCGDGDGSCFIASTMILMADSTQKRIDQIEVGDYVISGKTLEPVKVLIVEEQTVDSRALVGFNDIEPFATEDHCFMGIQNSRLTFNPNRAERSKHWSDLRTFKEGVELLDSNHEPVIVNRITTRNVPRSTPVWDLITDDHTYIANGVTVYDDFPEIDKHPLASLVILELLNIASRHDMSRLHTKRDCKTVSLYLFCTHGIEAVNRVKESVRDMSMTVFALYFRRQFENFVRIANQNSNFIYLGSDLWRHALDIIEESLEK